MRIDSYSYRDEWVPNYYPPRAVASGKYVCLSRIGTVVFLTDSERTQLTEILMDTRLYNKLESSGHIITAENAARVMQDLKVWHKHTFGGPELHIVVLTSRCNLNCTYCHMNPVAPNEDPERFDMQPDVEDAVIEFAFSSPSEFIAFEFQGGEAFLNFQGMVRFVNKVKKKNIDIPKDVYFSVVSNLTTVTEEQLRFCSENGIQVAYTLNGPERLHNAFRINRQGVGSFKAVMEKIEKFKRTFPDILSGYPLCVVGKDNANSLRETIDYFHALGFKSIGIIQLKPLGNAKQNALGFDIDEFLAYYIDALDYIYEKNRATNGCFSERIVPILLTKVLCRADTSYVDWRNPCGYVSGVITYDHDGEILPGDEARSLRHKFSLGNVTERSYIEMMSDRKTFEYTNLSLRDRDPVCRECAFNPYCGVAPILDYARTGDATPKPHISDECRTTIALFDWLFKKMIEDPLPLLMMLPGLDRPISELRIAAKSILSEPEIGERNVEIDDA